MQKTAVAKGRSSRVVVYVQNLSIRAALLDIPLSPAVDFSCDAHVVPKAGGGGGRSDNIYTVDTMARVQ